jgi:hypothetical protein
MKVTAQLFALCAAPAAGFVVQGPSSSAAGKLALSSADKYMESLAKGGGLPGSAEESSRVVRFANGSEVASWRCLLSRILCSHAFHI